MPYTSTCTGTSLINRAAILLLDTSNIRWPRPQLLAWINDAQRQVVLLKPATNNVIASYKLSAGARQSIPADGWLLLKITHNLGTDGSTAGPAIRICSRKLLDAQDLNWYNAAASTTVQNYVYSPQDQTAFYVYPPSTGSNYVELNYSKIPADLTVEANTIGVNDMYQGALLDYVMYRACSQDSEQANMQQLAQAYFTAFMTIVQSKDDAELQNNVNLDLSPPNNTVRGSA